MVMGGIPFYWSLLERGKSVSQNIDDLFFSPMGKLHHEYTELYDSLFKNPQPYVNVVSTLGTKRVGMTRSELIREGNIINNGQLTAVLQDLEACGFIRKYNQPDSSNQREATFQLIDNYTLFYYKFLHNRNVVDEHFWTLHTNTPIRNTWEGLAFERICFAHVKQIKQALGIAGVSTQVYTWQLRTDKQQGEGTQIDMVIERADRVINLCEMKFSTREYLIDKALDENLRHKSACLSEVSKSCMAIHLTLITPFGLKPNMYQFSVQQVIAIDDLFS